MPTHTHRIDTPTPLRLHQSFSSIWLCLIHLNWIMSNFQQTKNSEKTIKATTQLIDNNGDCTARKRNNNNNRSGSIFFARRCHFIGVIFSAVCPIKLQNSLFSPFFYCITYGLSLSTEIFFSVLAITWLILSPMKIVSINFDTFDWNTYKWFDWISIQWK